MIAFILAAFNASGLVTKLIIFGSVILALVIGYGIWYHHIYENGVKDTIAAIARADDKVVAKAKTARNAFLDCRNQGKQWNQETGACQ